MATLPDDERKAAWALFMQKPGGQVTALLKADVRAAVDAIDAWVDANATSFNNAIPQPARGQLTAKQKALLLVLVVERRHGVL